MARRLNKVQSRPIWVTLVFLILLIIAPFLLMGFIGRSSSHIESLEETEGLANIIGIDFGSSYSRVGIIRDGTVVLVPNQQGESKTPSYVAFNGKEILVGETARQQSIRKPDSAISGFKHLLGVPWSDRAMDHCMSNPPFGIKEQDGLPIFEIENYGERRSFTPEEATVLVFGKMKDIAEAFLEEKVTNAVVTVPTSFDYAQRQAIKDAGSAIGLNIVRVLNESTSAVIAHGLDRQNGEHQILVIDIGGGTLDVSLLCLDDGAFEVLATSSDMSLGGQVFNQRIMDNFSQRFNGVYGIDITNNVTAMAQLDWEVEKAKIALSTHENTEIRLNELWPGIELGQIFTRAQFEEMTESLRHQMMATITNALEDNHIRKDSIDDVLLVGGSANFLSLRRRLEAAFPGKIRVNEAIQPDEAVVHGAAIQAGLLSQMGQDSGCSLPAYLDYTKLSLGVETLGGIMTQIFPRETGTPTRKTASFTIVGKDHDVVTIRVFEGERPMTKDNTFLGSLDLRHSLATSEGPPQIEIAFAVGPDGFGKVSALDIGSGRSNSTLITSAAARLSEQKVREHISIAALHADADNGLRASLVTNVDDKREGEGRSELMYLPELQTNDDNVDISDEPQWGLKTWLSSPISRANKATRKYLDWHRDDEKVSQQGIEQDEL